MRSFKRYTNTTFTKRVDHKAGRHHTLRAAIEPGVCKECGALYIDRRWIMANSKSAIIKHQRFGPVQLVICPACKQQRNGVPGGYLHLDGSFFTEHRDEIERLLSNEADRAAQDNPLARIMKWEKSNGKQLTVETTTEHLAQRLGHALERAYCGKVRYDFSHENKLAHVWWRRD
ncbi:MAG: BCAM0308 family protein [Acidobacteriota bacterium]